MQHVKEGSGRSGHIFDWMAINALTCDPQVVQFMAKLEAKALLPVMREQRNGPNHPWGDDVQQRKKEHKDFKPYLNEPRKRR